MEKSVILSLDAKDRKTVLRYARKIAQMRSVPDGEQVSALEKLSKSLFAIKIGLLNIVDSGLPIVREVKAITGMEVICDLKLADIPYIAGEVAKKAADAGADYLVVQGFVGKKTLDQIVDAVQNMKVIVVSEMTHNDGGFTQKNLDAFALMAKASHVFGIIGPGNRPERLKRIKEIVGDEVKVIAAGVSVQQGGEETAAIDAGADLLIKGRSIMEQLDAQIGSTVFDWDWGKLKRHVLLPAALFGIVAVILNLYFSRSSVDETAAGVVTTTVFAILAVLVHNVLRR